MTTEEVQLVNTKTGMMDKPARRTDRGKQKFFLNTILHRSSTITLKYTSQQRQMCQFCIYSWVIRADNSTATMKVVLQEMWMSICSSFQHSTFICNIYFICICWWVCVHLMFANSPESLVHKPWCTFCNTLNTAYSWTECWSTNTLIILYGNFNLLMFLTLFQSLVT